MEAFPFSLLHSKFDYKRLSLKVPISTEQDQLVPSHNFFLCKKTTTRTRDTTDRIHSDLFRLLLYVQWGVVWVAVEQRRRP